MTIENLAVGVILLAVVCCLAALAHRFYRPKPDVAETDAQLAERQRADALRLHLEHQSLAEYHEALAVMYADRARRLQDYPPTIRISDVVHVNTGTMEFLTPDSVSKFFGTQKEQHQ